ncbi:MAG: exodeoxyribonuclease VII small subunit [Actinomycetota bacterium]|nr:exodeoxyribonuclease VII small subunit [Actinomycetota bacterium]
MTEASSDASVPPESMSYEQLVGNLEQLTQRMADGAIGIEEAVELYERAGRLEELARARLDRVQRRIENLAEESDGPTGPPAAESPDIGPP